MVAPGGMEEGARDGMFGRLKLMFNFQEILRIKCIDQHL
jgi:hypothetical protein